MEVKDLKKALNQTEAFYPVYFYSKENKCLMSIDIPVLNIMNADIACNLECEDNPIKRQIQNKELRSFSRVLILGG